MSALNKAVIVAIASVFLSSSILTVDANSQPGSWVNRRVPATIRANEDDDNNSEVTVTLNGVNGIVSRALVSNEFLIGINKESDIDDLKMAGFDEAIKAGEFSELFVIDTGDTDFVVLTRGNINVATENKVEDDDDEADKVDDNEDGDNEDENEVENEEENEDENEDDEDDEDEEDEEDEEDDEDDEDGEDGDEDDDHKDEADEDEDEE